jgi:hypothetical protein
LGFNPKDIKGNEGSALCGLFPFLFFCVVSCGNEMTGSRFFPSDAKLAKAQILLPVTDTPETQNLLHVIMPNGQRISLGQFQGNEKNKTVQTGPLEFLLSEKMLHSPRPRLWAEEFAALGQSLPDRLFKGSLSSDPAGVLMVELVSGFLPGKLHIAQFGRYEIPLSRRDLFSELPSVILSSVGDPWKAELKAGIVPIKVLDETNKPVSNAQVLAVNRDLSVSEDKAKSGLPIWKLAGYQPVTSATNDQGLGWAGPLFQNAKTPQFQLMVTAADRCPVALESTGFDGKNQQVYEVSTRKCSAIGKKPKAEFRLSKSESFNHEFREVIGKSQKVFLINQSKVTFEIDSQSNYLRPLEVVVHELTDNKTKVKWEAFKDPGAGTFRSLVNLELPPKFPFSGGENGNFSVTFSLLGSSADGNAEQERLQTETFYFSKAINKVIFDFLSATGDTQIYSRLGLNTEASLLNTLEKSQEFFEIRSTKCGANISFAAVAGDFISSKTKQYFPCEGGAVKFPYAALQNDSSNTEVNVSLFLKDPYGNVSESISGKNKRSVSVVL